MMILLYNGQKLKHKIGFRDFRKFATKFNLNYQSFEGGVWVEIIGDEKINHIQRLLR
ncbi:U exon [Mastadenovirus eidoli]|uniref:U exon n=1 Tax=Eidolon helvum adenovirus TaxID=2039267 RepID=A0A348FKH6_9ADEN|nr:U exon [Eidolon helvum adenovirus]BBF72843.1 U exon [Eidolon helvum adenovirus]